MALNSRKGFNPWVIFNQSRLPSGIAAFLRLPFQIDAIRYGDIMLMPAASGFKDTGHSTSRKASLQHPSKPFRPSNVERSRLRSSSVIATALSSWIFHPRDEESRRLICISNRRIPRQLL